jgi:hypothetical protein
MLPIRRCRDTAMSALRPAFQVKAQRPFALSLSSIRVTCASESLDSRVKPRVRNAMSFSSIPSRIAYSSSSPALCNCSARSALSSSSSSSSTDVASPSSMRSRTAIRMSCASESSRRFAEIKRSTKLALTNMAIRRSVLCDRLPRSTSGK